MATRIRLARTGSKKNANYRIVVTDKENPRDGKFLEILGQYDPAKGIAKSVCKKDRVAYWISKGAKPTETVQSILKALS